VQNFYRLLASSGEKVHDGTELTILQAVTYLMGMKSKYNFSNQCYNNIVKLIIDLIPMKHNMQKDLYQSKKIIAWYELWEDWCVRKELHVVHVEQEAPEEDDGEEDDDEEEGVGQGEASSRSTLD
jgi:hypothetical protein